MSHLGTLIDRYDREKDRRLQVQTAINMIEYVGALNMDITSMEVADATLRLKEFANTLPKYHAVVVGGGKRAENMQEAVLDLWRSALSLHDRAWEILEENRDPQVMMRKDMEDLLNDVGDLEDEIYEKEEEEME